MDLQELNNTLREVSAEVLAQQVIQVSLSTGIWGINRASAAATMAARQAMGVDDLAAVKGSTTLINPQLAPYKACLASRSAAMKTHAAMTMPHSTPGWGWLPTTSMLKYIEAMQKHKDDLTSALADLEQALPAELARAPKRLKTAYNPAMYPSTKGILGKFYIDHRFVPASLPSQLDKMQGLPSGWAAKIHQIMEETMADEMSSGMTRLWEGMADHAGRIVDVLSAVKPRIYENLLDDGVRHCDTMLSFNLAKSNTYAKYVHDYKDALVHYSIGQLRTSQQAKEFVRLESESMVSICNELLNPDGFLEPLRAPIPAAEPYEEPVLLDVDTVDVSSEAPPAVGSELRSLPQAPAEESNEIFAGPPTGELLSPSLVEEEPADRRPKEPLDVVKPADPDELDWL